ncbi:hypothetical protein D3C76_1424310 [compost metagenome]
MAIRDGKTSSEILRRKSYSEELEELEAGIASEEESHVEYAVLDKAGRLQIPSGYLESLGLSSAANNKVRVSMEEGRIVLLPRE